MTRSTSGNDDESSLPGAATTPEEHFYDSLEDSRNNSRLSNASKHTSRSVNNNARKTNKKDEVSDNSLALDLQLSRESSIVSESNRVKSGSPKPIDDPANKKPKASRLPVRRPGANKGVLPPTDRQKLRTSKSSRIPVSVRGRRDAQKTLAPTKMASVSRIPIRVGGITSKPLPLNRNGTRQGSARSLARSKPTKPPEKDLRISAREKAPFAKRQSPGKTTRPNSEREKNLSVAARQKSSGDEAKFIRDIGPEKLSADRLKSKTDATNGSENKDRKKFAKDVLVSNESKVHPTTDTVEENTTVAKQTLSVSPIWKTTQQLEGKLSLNGPSGFLKDMMKSLLSDLQNKCQILERAVEIEGINEFQKQTQEKQENFGGLADSKPTEDMHFDDEPLYTSTPKYPQTYDKDLIDEKVENSDTEVGQSLENKPTTTPKDPAEDDKKSVLETVQTQNTKEEGSSGREKKSTPNTNESAHIKPKPKKATNSTTPEETVWDRLAKKPNRTARNKNDKPGIAKNGKATQLPNQPGSLTKNKSQTSASKAKSQHKKPKPRQNSPENTMLANATNVFAAGLRFHTNEKHTDNSKRTKTKFDVAKETYLSLLKQCEENENKIEANQREIERQEIELDKVYEETENNINEVVEFTSELADARKIHTNFKDEANRVRVLHKTNMLAADIYEADTIILQGQITELQQEINELKAINRLDPDELKEKIQVVLAHHDGQRERNKELEEQINGLRNKLNEINCGDEPPETADDSSGNLEQEATKDEQTQDEEITEGIMVNTHDNSEVVIGHSKSAGIVSENEAKTPRETKSDQNQSPRETEKVPVHVKPYLHRRRSSLESDRHLLTPIEAEFPPGDSDQMFGSSVLPPIQLTNKQHPDEVMPSMIRARHPVWPRPNYTHAEIPGCHIPLPPLHPRPDDGYNPMFGHRTKYPAVCPLSIDRDIPTPAISTPLPSICPRPAGGANKPTNQVPHPPVVPRPPLKARPSTAARRVPFPTICLPDDSNTPASPASSVQEDRKSPSCSNSSESCPSGSESQSLCSSERESLNSTPTSQLRSPPLCPRLSLKETPLPSDHTPRPPSPPSVSNSRKPANQISKAPTDPPEEDREKKPWWKFEKKKRERKPPSPKLPPANKVVTVNGVSIRFL